MLLDRLSDGKFTYDLHLSGAVFFYAMKIGVIGASGFIGKAFTELATEEGHEVIGFSRKQKEPSESVSWRVWNETPDLSGLEAVVNYAGETVAQRWTAEIKKALVESRVGVTDTLVKGIGMLPEDDRPRVLMNASGVGYYGERGDEKLDEGSSRGSGFLSDLCEDWEGAALAAEDIGVRVVLGRIGMVLGKGGAAWDQMKMIFSLGCGGPLAGGKQWMPWIHVTDVAGATLYALENEQLRGPVNLVSPDPLMNKDFTKILASHLSRPAVLPVPEFALRLLYGEFGKHLLESYRAYPKALEEAGYTFKSSHLKDALQMLG